MSIFLEKASGARHNRPQLAKALAVLDKGDTLACYKLDRIGRSLPHLVSILEELETRGAHFKTTEDGLSTKGSTGKFVLNIMASVAAFERSLMLERTRAGLAAAKARSNLLGVMLAALDADGHHAAKPITHLAFGDVMTWVSFQAGVQHTFDADMILKMFRNALRVFRCPLEAQVTGAETAHQEPGCEQARARMTTGVEN
jgi:hypothetical protein